MSKDDKDKDPFYADADTIYTYTDEMAVVDGVLVDIAPFRILFRGRYVNRITETVKNWFEGLWFQYQRTVDDEISEEPFSLPIMLMILEVLLEHAEIPDDPSDMSKVVLRDGRVLWLVHNEVSGFTLMFPEDY